MFHSVPWLWGLFIRLFILLSPVDFPTASDPYAKFTVTLVAHLLTLTTPGYSFVTLTTPSCPLTPPNIDHLSCSVTR